ncbi:MAG: hypothetical protein AB8F94_09515 [Saprospiraceae bacterium]
MITELNSLRTLFAILLIIFPILLFSQKKSLHLSQGRLFTTEGIEVRFVNLNQQGSIFTIQSRKGVFDTFDQNEVLRIEKRTGTEALAWGGYLGAIGLVEGMLLARVIETPRYLIGKERRVRDRRIVLGSTLIGTLIGVVVGYSRIKYEKVYDDPAFSFASQNIGLNFSTPNQVSSLTLSVHF